jgi:hypothetical protein
MAVNINNKKPLACPARVFIDDQLWFNTPHSLAESTKEQQRCLIQFLWPGGTNIREI